MRKSHNDDEPTVEAIRVSLVELRRLFQRKELTALWAEAAGGDAKLDYADLRLLDAVRVAEARGEGGATVGDVAVLLGVDPSRASRLVASAVERGLLERRAAQDDARKVVLAVTSRGSKLQARGSDLTRARIALAVEAWPASRRERFAAELAEFVVGMTDQRASRRLTVQASAAATVPSSRKTRSRRPGPSS
ncbi:MAG: MarR family winged helix-turn-helix transcriptional regulator [Polyangiaceae bacterium]